MNNNVARNRLTCRSSRLISALLLALTGAAPSQAEQMTAREIADLYARPLVTSGETPGIGVAVIIGDAPPTFFTYGQAVVGSGFSGGKPFTPDALFEIASNTKVFTTNLFGQRVADGRLRLGQPLSDFQAQLGTLKPLTRDITLQQLADFTSGVALAAPQCGQANIPGCLPSSRPTIHQYTGRDFAEYFRFIVPRDFTMTPPSPVDRLPAPYNYSNFSVGLLGLLMAAPPDQPLNSADVHRWFQLVRRDILLPLNMRDTFLFVPEAEADRRVAGYDRTLAHAIVANGGIARIVVDSPGSLYASPPRVTISGGGGSGATAVATLDGDGVGEIGMRRRGAGYNAPAKIIFSGGGSTTSAVAEVITSEGRVVGVTIQDGGDGYQTAPRVSITGGMGLAGRNAAATAHIANGRVTYLSVDDPGAGYVESLSVIVETGGGTFNPIPTWAAAGALAVSLRDMAKFAQAALGRPAGVVPRRIARGFEIAQRPYACQGTTDPDLASCPPGAPRSALSWMVTPADMANSVPAVISKAGGLDGFSSYTTLMPARGLGVVVFMNISPDQADAPVAVSYAANNILYALFYAGCGVNPLLAADARGASGASCAPSWN